MLAKNRKPNPTTVGMYIIGVGSFIMIVGIGIGMFFTHNESEAAPYVIIVLIGAGMFILGLIIAMTMDYK